jgi:L-fucose isomerase-like protein
MDITVTYEKKDAPSIGFLMVTIESEFDKNLKEIVKNRFKELFESYKNNGVISDKSLFFDYCYDENDVRKACETMLDNRIDGIIYHPLTWPAGETISALATFRYLKDIPIFVSASPEVFQPNQQYPCVWPLNSDCGKIFARSVFYKLDRASLWATGMPEDPQYREELSDFFKVCNLVKNIKKARVAVIGNIMDDFPESFYNPMTVRREIGARVMEIDSSVLFTLYETGSYAPRGLKIDEKESGKYIEKLKEMLQIKVEDSVLSKSAKSYLSYKSIIESVGADAAIFRCGPEWVEKHGIVVCGVMSELIDNGVIVSGGCEGDVLNTISGLLQYYASGNPTTCLDWIDKPGRESEGVYNLLHCGNACKSMITPGTGTADYQQAWPTRPLGCTIEGSLKKGPVTVSRIRENRDGKLELLIAEGQSVAESMKIRGNYGLVDFGKDRLEKIVYEINENGWPHHLSLGWGHHGDILEKSVRFLGDIKVVRI